MSHRIKTEIFVNTLNQIKNHLIYKKLIYYTHLHNAIGVSQERETNLIVAHNFLKRTNFGNVEKIDKTPIGL